MAEKYTGNLVQSKGYCTFRGIIAGKDNPRKGYGYEEGTDKNQKKYRKIRFMVKTSPDNMVPVELFGGIRDDVYAYNSKSKETKKIAWAKRNDKLPDGFAFINPVEFDLVQDLKENYKDGDSIFIKGEPQFSTYEDNQNKIKLQVKYIIKNVYKTTEPVDFTSDKFEEDSKFVQDIVIRDITEDTKEKKLFVSAYIILYGGKFEPADFIVDTEKNSKFAKNMKGLKFGDSIKVNGIIQNRALTEDVEEDTGWGTKARAATNVYRALEITGADGDTLEKKKYKEEDFVKNESEATFNGTGDAAKKVLEQLEKEQAEGTDDLPFNLDD
jgi:single-stranded DNA-binding protein